MAIAKNYAMRPRFFPAAFRAALARFASFGEPLQCL